MANSMRPMRSLEDRSRRLRRRFTEEKLVKIRTEHNNVGLFRTLLAAFLILAHVAPDFIDSILYTPEELRIINY